MATDLNASTSSLPPSRIIPHTQTSSLTPEVQSTLLRLSTHKNVQGVLILARDGGGIIQSTGAAFEDVERGRSYAKLVRDLVEVMAKGAESGLDILPAPGAISSRIDQQDDLRLMRIRTTRHELIVSPDPRFLLVVLQDPSQ